MSAWACSVWASVTGPVQALQRALQRVGALPADLPVGAEVVEPAEVLLQHQQQAGGQQLHLQHQVGQAGRGFGLLAQRQLVQVPAQHRHQFIQGRRSLPQRVDDQVDQGFGRQRRVGAVIGQRVR